MMSRKWIQVAFLVLFGCRAADKDEDANGAECQAEFTLHMPDGSRTSLDYCKRSYLDATFEFDPDRPPEVRAPTLNFSSVGSGSFDCSITIEVPAACGGGYYRMNDTAGEVWFTTYDCTGVGDAYEGSYTSDWGYLKLNTLSAGEVAGDLSGKPLLTTIEGRLDVYNEASFRVEGSFSLRQEVTSGDAEEAPCRVSDGDEDDDGYISDDFGGTDPDDADPSVPDDSSDSPGDSPGDSSNFSCLFEGGDVCYQTNEPDNEAWCLAQAGGLSYSDCPSDPDGRCDFAGDGDFTASATAYYYNGYQGRSSCEDNNGTYSSG